MVVSVFFFLNFFVLVKTVYLYEIAIKSDKLFK